jgi:hypothetical protein
VAQTRSLDHHGSMSMSGVALRRLLIVVAGMGALVGAVLMLPSPLPAAGRFGPSTAQLAVARQQGWNIPPECSAQVPEGNGPNLFISRGDNGRIFTVYRDDVVQVNDTETLTKDSITPVSFTTNDYNPTFSPTTFVCGTDASDESQWTTYALRPGLTTIYFPAPSMPLAIVELKVIAGGPASAAPSIALGVLGLGLIAGAILLGPVYRRRQTVDDLRRADDAQRAPALDPAAFSRQAWDVFDERPGPGI